MKRKLISAMLAAVVLCVAVPAQALAAPVPGYVNEGQSSASTSVSYTIGANYTVMIPASINLNEGNEMEITASVMNIAYGQSVSVFIDGSSTFENGGNFYLHNGEEKISCAIKNGNNTINGLDFLVARFDNGELDNSVIDPICFEAGTGAPGTYTGTLYFRISLA
ncbi:MAG: hypothetical protein PHD67_05620 [Oscillospiraceae bacterium]|nr:hypothetical protein [Oscillospiraceae bacterium]